MFFADPEQTPYDLRFPLLGVRVRVHPLFWAMSGILGWSLHVAYGFEYLLIWILCVFLSILIHEMGHVLVGKMFGADGHIVLYSFGGLAIGSSALHKRWQRIAVYLAGPLFQLILFAALWLPDRTFDFFPRWQDSYLEAARRLLLYINFYWAVLNLIPIFPLDGGQVIRDSLDGVSSRWGNRLAFQISILISGFLALHAILCELQDKIEISYIPIPYLPNTWFHAILFGMLMMMNIQLLQAENSRNNWIDDRTPWDDPNW